MAKTAAQLIATVRARAGRASDQVLITAAFTLDALNEAQLEIVRRSPGLLDLDVSDETTFQVSTADTEVDIESIDPAHIQDIWLLNGAATRRRGIRYRPKDEHFERYIIIAGRGDGEWLRYTRQGTKLIFDMPLASDYDELFLRIDYTAWATPFDAVDSDDESDLKDADKGLIFFALAEIYDEIATSNPKLEVKALKTRALFENWLSMYQDYNQTRIEELHVGD